MTERSGGESAPRTAGAPGDRDGRFEIEMKDGDVFLTVHPHAGTGHRIDLSHVVQALKARGIEDFDEERVNLAVNLAAGTPVPIGAHHAAPAQPDVEITDDGLQAFLTVRPPGRGGADIDAAAIEAALAAAGVREGILQEEVAAIVAKRAYGVRRLVAKGRRAVPGKDGRIVLHVETEAKRPQEDAETGRVDHRELGLIVNVQKGDLLATVEPPEPGVPGLSVRGEIIPATPGRAVASPAGKEVEVSADGREVRAAVAGRVTVVGPPGHEKINVSPVFEVHGSVGAETGNVHFVGSVVVKEGVEDGYTVEAEGDITIGGVVEKALIKAGGDIVIRGGFMGKREGKVEAGGSVRTKFVQDGNVAAERDVVVSEYVLHSIIDGDRVLVGYDGGRTPGAGAGGGGRKRKGLVMGGQIRATREIACHELGSPMSTKTEVQVGLNPRLAERLDTLTKQLQADRETFDRVRKGLAVLENLKQRLGALPPEKTEIYASLTGTEGALRARLVQMAEELRGLQAQQAKPTRARVSVSGRTYPGVKVMVRNESFFVNKETNFTTYILEDGKVRPVPFESPKVEARGEDDDDESVPAARKPPG